MCAFGHVVIFKTELQFHCARAHTRAQNPFFMHFFLRYCCCGGGDANAGRIWCLAYFGLEVTIRVWLFLWLCVYERASGSLKWTPYASSVRVNAATILELETVWPKSSVNPLNGAQHRLNWTVQYLRALLVHDFWHAAWAIDRYRPEID